MSEMVLSNEMVLIEQYANDRPWLGGRGAKLPLKLLDIQWKPQICLLFNIWRRKKSQLSAVCMIKAHFPDFT